MDEIPAEEDRLDVEADSGEKMRETTTQYSRAQPRRNVGTVIKRIIHFESEKVVQHMGNTVLNVDDQTTLQYVAEEDAHISQAEAEDIREDSNQTKTE